MKSAICTAIQEGRPYLDRFTRREYTKAFREYEKTYWEGCHKELEENRENLQQLAIRVINELEEDRRRTRFWNRGAKAFDEKQTVIKYLAPMLLEHGEDIFADRLRDAWCRRWPKDTYEYATFETLKDAFLNVILGIQLKN